jgi:hypothetical protein
VSLSKSPLCSTNDQAQGSSPSVSARSRRGPGLPREHVQRHRRSADQAQLHAAPCAWTTHSLRHLLSRAANVLICRIECTSVMSGLGGAPAALPGVDAGRCRRRTGRGSGRCGGTAGPRSGRPGGVAWGRSLGCRPIWATAAVKLGGRPFDELRPALAWRDDLRENGGALDGVRALPAKEKNFSFRGCIRRPMGHPPGPTTCTAVCGAPPLRKKVVSLACLPNSG